jgi:mono/diheme cytochrome c family protein
MTKTQIWIGAFVLTFILLFFLQELTTKKEEHPGMMTDNNYIEKTEGNTEGAELVGKFGCITCHGSDFKGTVMAPALYGLSTYYSRDELINYLRNPESYMDKERFQAFKEKYRTIMPSFNNKDVKDLGKIADYILGL